jgi:long-chain acyl-CoA synthetase
MVPSDWNSATRDDVVELSDLLELASARYGERPFLQTSGKDPITFADVARFARGLSAYLDSMGVDTGARVAVVYPNSPLLALLFLGVIATRRVLIPLNPASSSAELIHIFSDTKPALILSERSRAEVVRGTCRGASVIEVSDEWDFVQTIFDQEAAALAPGSDPERDSEIVYTSGSSGMPKGVVLSHRSLLADSFALGQLFDFSPGTSFLTLSPLFHNSGQVFTTLTPLWCGGRTAIAHAEMATLRFWQLVEEFQAEWTLVVTSVLALLARSSPPRASSSLRGILAGGSALGASLMSNFESRFGARVYQCYGLTETTSVSTCERPDESCRALGSAGTALPICSIRINHADASGIGEILIRGENLLTRYLHLPELTSERLQDGWLHTGDVGHIDDDGHLFIVDRVDNMLIVGGENVYPSEIDRLVAQLDGVKDAVTVGIPHDVMGIDLVFVYEPEVGRTPEPRNWTEIFVRELSTFKIPRHRVSVQDLGFDSVPRAANGKVLRKPIEQRARDLLPARRGGQK